MKKNYIARRRGTSVAAAALSFALVAPLAQPVAFAQEAPAAVAGADAAKPEATAAAGEPYADATYLPGVVNDADAIYSPGVVNGKKTVSGTVLFYDQFPGSSNGNTAAKGDFGKALPAAGSGVGENFKGATVYAQWFEKPDSSKHGDNPAVASPVYKTTVNEDGTYAINMRPYIDSDGKYREFDAQYNIAAGGRGQKVKIWVDGYDRDEYVMVRGYGERQVPDGILTDDTGGAGWGSAQRTLAGAHQVFVKRANAEQMLGDESGWRKMDATEVAANGKEGGSFYGKAYWNLNQGQAAIGQKEIVGDKNDRRIEGLQVVAAYLSDKAVLEIQKHVEENKGTEYQGHDLRSSSWDVNDELKLQAWINEQIAENPDWIAERVVTETDGNGDYRIQFKGTYGINPNKAGKVAPELAGTVADSFADGVFTDNQISGRENAKHVNWDWLFVDAPNLPTGVSNMGAWRGNVWQGLTSNPWGIADIGGVSGTPYDMRGMQKASLSPNYNVGSWDMALMPNKIHFAVDKYDSLTNFARPGDSTHAFTEGLPGFNLSALYQVEWKDGDGNVVNTCKAVDAEGNLIEGDAAADSLGMPAKSDGTLPNCEITVPEDLDKMTTYTATLYGIDANGDRVALASDSFTALVKTAAEVSPQYDPTFVQVGVEDHTEKPKFVDAKTGELIDPSDERLQGAEYTLHEEALPEGWTASIDESTGVITVTPGPNGVDGEELQPGDTVNLPVRVKYADGTANGAYAPIVIGEQKDFYDPEYKDESGKPGDKVTVDKPVFKDKDGKETTPPEGTKFEKGEGAPEGVTVNEDGSITVDVPENAKPGDKIEVPVVVTYPDGSTDEKTVTVTVGNPDAPAPTPSVTKGDNTTVPANNEPHTVGKVENPTGDETGKLVDKDGKEIPDSKVEIDPKTGEITVTVPEGTDPQDAKVIVSKGEGEDAEKIGEIDVKIVDPNYGEPTKVEAGKKESSKNPFGENGKAPEGTKATGTESEGSEDWTFTTDPKSGVVEAQSPSYEKVGEKIAEKLPEIQKQEKGKRWDEFVKIFTPFAKPSVDVEFTYPNGSKDNATADFDLVGKDGKSLLDPDGDFDDDGISNREEIEKGTNPADETSKPTEGGQVKDTTAPTVNPIKPGDKTISGTGDRPGEDIKVTLPNGKVIETRTDKDGNWKINVPSGVELKPGDEVIVSDGAGNKNPAQVGIDTGKCVATSLGFGLPLLALIPLGLATQMEIPGLSDVVADANAQLQAANTQIQQQLGLFNPEIAAQVDAANKQLAQFGADLGTVAAGIALIAAGILAGTLIYDNCSPNGGGSSVKDLELKGSSGKTYAGSSKKEEGKASEKGAESGSAKKNESGSSKKDDKAGEEAADKK